MHIKQTTMICDYAFRGVIKNGKEKPKIIVKRASESGTSDPLEQRNTIGWKNFFTAKRLNEMAMVRIETGASA